VNEHHNMNAHPRIILAHDAGVCNTPVHHDLAVDQ
jgi:hypothetical protein